MKKSGIWNEKQRDRIICAVWEGMKSFASMALCPNTTAKIAIAFGNIEETNTLHYTLLPRIASKFLRISDLQLYCKSADHILHTFCIHQSKT